MQNFVFNISESAKLRLQNVLKEGEAFLIDVTSGGCNGFSYKYNIVQNIQETILQNPNIVVTNQAKEMVNGSTLDYTADEFGTAFFSITNPNATSKCGCGNSFSTF